MVVGFAAITHGELRFTADVDIALNRDDVSRWACAAKVEETWRALPKVIQEE
jgi:hypothetical protein